MRRHGFRAVAAVVALAILPVAVLIRPPAAAAVTVDQLRITNVTDPIVRGANTNFTVQLVQPDGSFDTGYRGRVHVTSSDPAAQLPPDYTFQASDNGQHTFTMNWINDGTQSLTVEDIAEPSLTQTYDGITVTKAVALTITGLTDPVMRGVATSFTVSAVDFRGVPDPRYSGVVHITSTDPSATLPGDYSFGQADHGAHSFSFQLKWATPGNQSITATDIVNAGFVATYSGIEVTQSTALRFTGIQDPVAHGVVDPFALDAVDRFGNRDPLYRGTVHFTSTDPAATLPADYTFIAVDNGVHNFQVMWQQPGPQSLTAADTVDTALAVTKSGITVSTTSNLQISGLTDPVVRGVNTSVVVKALDSEANPDGSYRGTVHFTSTDPAATLPADYTFTAGDNGQHVFSFQLRWITPGLRNITVRDTVNAQFTDTYHGIEVTSAATLGVGQLDDPIGRGAIDTFSVRALDPYGTVDPLYRGTVHVTSTDPAATLPADYTYVAADNGQHSFQLSWGTPGTRKLTVADNAVASINGSKGGIFVTTTAAIRLSGILDPIVRGSDGSVVVTAKDATGKTDAGYRGTVHFTSTDPSAVLPPDYTFKAADNGTHAFSFVGGTGVRWMTPGNRTLNVVDTAVASLADNRSGITVTKAVDVQMTGVLDPIPEQANDLITIRAVDAFGAADPLYTGTVRFTSNDPAASLPADYTFVGADHGAHNFNVVWHTPGDRTLTVRDTAVASMTDRRLGITVTALVRLLIQGLAEPLVRGSSDMFTVRAVDAAGRTATAYLGTVHFTSSDPSAVLPADYTFVAGDQGAHNFNVTWMTAGSRSLTVADTATPSLNGTVADITITRAVRYAFAGIADPIVHGVADPFTLKAVDQFGNVDTLYRGTVHFTATDGAATLPADYTFVAGDNGQHAFSVTWTTLGEQSITVTDTGDGAVTTTRSAVTVT